MAGGLQPEFEILPPEKREPGSHDGRTGKPTLLTPETLDWMCRVRAEGLSVTRACKALGIDEKTHRNWMKWGKRDNESGTNSIYADYFRRIPAAEELGTFKRREFVRTKIEEGKPESIAQAKAMLAYEIALESGKLARLQYELKKQALKQGAPALPASTQNAAPPMDMSAFTPEEWKEWEALEAKAQADFAGMTQAEVARFQELLRKGRGQDTQDEERVTT